MFANAFKATFGVGCALVVGIIAIVLVAGALASRSAVNGPTPSLGGTTATTAPATAAAARTASPPPSPIVLRGTGQAATDPITLPAPISLAAFTHDGQRNFIVQVFRGTTQTLLINTIGAYRGTRPLTGTEPLKLNIEADGPWTVTITPITCCATSGAFVGLGDAVSNQFAMPGAATWDFAHDGKRNFVVLLHCPSGDQLVQNRIGVFQGNAILVIPPGPCYWEVQADGNWSIKPR